MAESGKESGWGKRRVTESQGRRVGGTRGGWLSQGRRVGGTRGG